MCIGLHVKYPLFSFDLNETGIFFDIFEKSSNIKFHEIRPVGGELFHADSRIDVTKLIAAFRNFVNAPKNVPLGAFYG